MKRVHPVRRVRRGTQYAHGFSAAHQLPPMLPLAELPPHVLHVLHRDHEFCNLCQLSILRIVDEIRATDSVIGLPGVCMWVIVHDDHPPEIAESTQIFDIEAFRIHGAGVLI